MILQVQAVKISEVICISNLLPNIVSNSHALKNCLGKVIFVYIIYLFSWILLIFFFFRIFILCGKDETWRYLLFDWFLMNSLQTSQVSITLRLFFYLLLVNALYQSDSTFDMVSCMKHRECKGVQHWQVTQHLWNRCPPKWDYFIITLLIIMLILRQTRATILKFIAIKHHYQFNTPQSQALVYCLSDTLHA